MSWFYATYRSKAKNNRTGSSVQVRPSQQDRVNATWNQWQRTERQALTIRRGSERTVVAIVLQRWTHFYYFVTHPGCVLEYWLLFFFFIAEEYFIVCLHHTLSIHNHGRSDGVRFGIITNKASLNTDNKSWCGNDASLMSKCPFYLCGMLGRKEFFSPRMWSSFTLLVSFS